MTTPPNTPLALSAGKGFLACIESDLAEDFLDLLLNFMGVAFLFNRKFRRNIENFNGRYLFRSRDDRITVGAVFQNETLKIKQEAIENTHVTVTFRDAKALMNYLLSPKPDILGSILRQDVTIDGNLSYLYKFAYMAKHLQLMAMGQA